MNNNYTLKEFNSFNSRFIILLPLIIWMSLTSMVAQADWNDPGATVILNSTTEGYRNSMLEIEGRPAIAYCDVNANYQIKYRRANNDTGTSWGGAVSVDGVNYAGYTCLDMEIVNGHPAVTNSAANLYDLRYTRALDSEGGSWSSTIVVEPNASNAAIYFVDLEVVNGYPAIAYFDSSNNDLYYVRATDADGSAWGAPILVTSSGVVGQYLSLSVIDGQPAISYFKANAQDLMYVRATDADGATWGSPIAVWTGGDVGMYTSLTTVNGNPAIAFLDLTNTSVLYVRATDSAGTAWSTPSTVTSQRGDEMELMVVDGRPAIAYFARSGANDLRYAYSQDVDGNNWNAAQIIDDGSNNIGNYFSMSIINGKPAISYQDKTNRDLKYIRATYANGQPLPVELAYFRGELASYGVDLYWQTANEQFNRGFEVQRSSNGQSWQAIDFVTGVGISNQSFDYMYTDHTIPHKNVYYRLKQIDYDGAFEYSNLIEINIRALELPNILIYPTSVHTDINVEGGQGTIAIYNLLGQAVLPDLKYQSSTTIPLNNLSSGQYFLQIQNEKGIVVKTAAFVKAD